MPKDLPLLLTLLVALSGCTTPLVQPPKQSISVQTLNGTEPIAGLSCNLVNDYGQWTVITPGSVDVITSEQDLVVTCVNQQASRGTVNVVARPTPGYLSNPIPAVVVPVGAVSIIDQQVRGVIQAYPSPVQVMLNQDIIVTASQ